MSLTFSLTGGLKLFLLIFVRYSALAVMEKTEKEKKIIKIIDNIVNTLNIFKMKKQNL